MLKPFPLSSSTDVSFVDYSFVVNACITSDDTNMLSNGYNCSSSSPAEDHTLASSCNAESNVYNKSFDCNTTESSWVLALDKALLEPTPIYESSIPYDKSKDDAILSFVSLLTEQQGQVVCEDFPLSTEEEKEANTSTKKVSRSQCKRRRPSIDQLSRRRTLIDVQAPETKKQKTRSGSSCHRPRIRNDHNTKWEQIFQQLVQFKSRHGHTSIPKRGDEENHLLLQWTKRQRYQYNLKQQGKQSTMTASRMKSLESIGFVWDAHASQWEERFKELQTYKLSHDGNPNVPTTYPSNPKLATWVKRQRREFRLRFNNKVSGMTDDRIAALNSLGFQWNVRQRKNNNKKT